MRAITIQPTGVGSRTRRRPLMMHLNRSISRLNQVLSTIRPDHQSMSRLQLQYTKHKVRLQTISAVLNHRPTPLVQQLHLPVRLSHLPTRSPARTECLPHPAHVDHYHVVPSHNLVLRSSARGRAKARPDFPRLTTDLISPRKPSVRSAQLRRAEVLRRLPILRVPLLSPTDA